MKSIAMVVSSAVEPRWMLRVIIEVGDINHQRVSLPFCPRIAVEEIDAGKMIATVDVDAAVVVHELVRDLNHLRRLRDLEWKRDKIGRASCREGVEVGSV